MKFRILQHSSLFYLLLLILVWSVKDHVFFWDTIQLGSKQAHWYFENQFSTFLLPESIDSGHPPLFGFYLAVVWTIFGKTLLVSHLAMLPFLFGIIFYLQKIGQYLGNKATSFFLLCLFFADPVILSQSLLISPDLILMCFFLMALWNIFSGHRKTLFIAAIGMAMISMRGMMVVFMLYLFDLIHPFLNPNRPNKSFISTAFQKLLPYIPSGLLALAFLAYHYQQTGWIGYHADSPWAASFEKINGFGGLMKNIAVLAWRYLDFGRIFLWGIAFLAVWKIFKNNLWKDARVRQLTLLLFLSILILAPSQLMHKYLVVHRYNIPGFIALTLLIYYMLFGLLSMHQHLIRRLFIIALIGLASGNLWVYPKKISQGWDSTLAHFPYYKLRQQMYNYLEDQQISKIEVGTAFPELDAIKFKDLSDSEDQFSRKDLDTQDYILYSNIMNDFTDEEIDALEKDWEIMQEYRKMQVCFILYKRK